MYDPPNNAQRLAGHRSLAGPPAQQVPRLTDRVGSLEGVDRMETAMITSYAKRAAPAL
ncbi:hypothetical protein [Streptomyces sp. ME19-01-6]|uniref:hypothetical protein n=1 Tax=Streptomyces sp. ME19-01-6 TaxID=3028686 RepID=UPI0029BEA1B9|nr:hypothetical protein [Streptomyces sp. ME19-01-6]MDX3232192.1 hypothetical protein [Streptomyces sp. ME19-01-6]